MQPIKVININIFIVFTEGLLEDDKLDDRALEALKELGLRRGSARLSQHTPTAKSVDASGFTHKNFTNAMPRERSHGATP